MSYGNKFVLTLFTNDVKLARRADEAGIDRVGLDLEKIGKVERQGHLRSRISNHEIHQLSALRQSLLKAKLFVRTNPMYAGLQEEVNRLIGDGAEVLMLPMFETVREAATFVEFVAGRAEVSLLVETAAAVARIDKIVKLQGIDEIHIGLNDLYLSFGLKNHFEVLSLGLMNMLSDVVNEAGISFGFGGVARVNDATLPVPSDLVYAQYPRLRADRALVSRVFISPDYTELDLTHEVATFRHRMDEWYQCSEQELIQARDALWERARTM